uniref:NADH-ubiquinone oxidoreductase chain 4L n=1 Tax=Bathysciadiidae sp. MNHN-IM-2013-40843 TaxID=2496596 RepID=A0A6B7FNL5_9GAST|nr:NADH dehydrogenase subunit 4L [Bathysciadiidae sp. MNHN-IM-2013-40843]
MMVFLGVWGFFFSLLSLSFQFKYLLSALLSLEALTLSLFLVFMSMGSWGSSESFKVLIFLTFGGCEASMGLGVLVSLIRAHGNDYVESFNLQKC